MDIRTLYLKAFSLSLVSGMILLFSGCSERKSDNNIVEIVDDLGRKVKIPEKPERVMALSSSLTEMLFLICEEGRICGRTHNCDYPAQALKKEIVSNYPLDYEKLFALDPDLVVAKEGIISLEEAAKVESMGIPVYFQKYKSGDDILNGIRKLGVLLDKKERAGFAADSIANVLSQLKSSVAGKDSLKVLLLISKEQLFVFGKDSYASDFLAYAGAQNAMKETLNNEFPLITSEYILKIQPDVLIGLKGTGMDNGEFFELYPELKRLELYKNKKYYTFPEDLLSRPGPRVGTCVSQLIHLIHPDVQ